MPDIIKGKVSNQINLVGTLTEISPLTGTINASSINDFDQYRGPYEVVPGTNAPQILSTKNKTLLNNITVTAIPFYETSNQSNGITVYIGKEVEYGLQ